MEKTYEQKTFGEMKIDLEKALKRFSRPTGRKESSSCRAFFESQ